LFRRFEYRESFLALIIVLCIVELHTLPLRGFSVLPRIKNASASNESSGHSHTDRREEGKNAFDTGETLLARGTRDSYRDALASYLTALSCWRATRETQAEAVTLSRISLVFGLLNQPEQALPYDYQALKLARALKDVRGEALVLQHIGNIQGSIGENRKAVASLIEALDDYRKVGDENGEASTLTMIGAKYTSMGERQIALDSLNKALSLWRTVGDKKGEANALNHLGGLYEDLGEKQRALNYFSDAVPLCRAVKDRFGEAQALNNAGQLFVDSGDTKTGLHWLDQALSIVKADGNRAGEARTLINIAVAYRGSGEKKKALESIESALGIMREVGDREGEAAALDDLGWAYYDLGEKEKALDNMNLALNATRTLGDREHEGRALSDIALVERDLGRLQDARTHIESALPIIESLRVQLSSQELRTLYFSTVESYYDLDVDVLMRLHDQDRTRGFNRLALSVSERGRARTLLEILGEANADIRQGVDPELLKRERDLQELLDSKSASLRRLLSGPVQDEHSQSAARQIDDLLSQYQALEAEIRTASPHYAALTQPQPLNEKEIQDQVLDDPSTVLLEYALGTDRSYLWLVTPTSLDSFILPPRSEIESQVTQAYGKLSKRDDRASEREPDSMIVRLSETVLAPVASQIEGKRLLIVPDGALAYVPFGALFSPREAKGFEKRAPLAISHEIVYLPSASTLAILRREHGKRQPPPKAVAVLADPVFNADDQRVVSNGRSPTAAPNQVRTEENIDPGTQLLASQLTRSEQDSGIGVAEGFRRLRFSRTEADGIVNLFPSDTALEDLDFKASKATATSPILGQYKIVHFATHGLLDSVRPELSGVVLSTVAGNGASVDGFLRLHDIFNLTLPADLVVLSACQTGLAQQLKGEGLVGLTRGFMYAGANRVVVSLWSVNDPATAELMKRFYDAMVNRKMTAAGALRAAQKSMWEDSRWSASYYWAAFVLQGEWK
jgi:CHAT domain-containing protein/Tfp pilus assembly protein PilF